MNDSVSPTSHVARYEKLQMLLNALLFQCLWFSIMVFEHTGLVVFLGALFGQFFYQRSVSKTTTTFILPIVVFGLGVSFDISFAVAGLFEFPTHGVNHGIADIHLLSIPLWLISLWLGFVLTLQHSLQWVRVHRYVCMLVFAIFGPVSYIAGREFGMIQFSDDVAFYLALVWAVVGWVASFQLKLDRPEDQYE
jgi:hypothetical protein